MSRSMIAANQYIFQALAEFVEDQNIERPIFADAKRCIETDDREKEWLKKLTIQNTEIILPTFITASFEFEEQKYFVTIGSITQLLTETEIIQEEELNGGMITALIFELEIPVKQSAKALEIVEEIFYEPDENITKYHYSQVSKFFEPIFVYRVQDECPFIEGINDTSTVNIVRLSGFYILKNRQIISLRFEKETIFIFERLFLEGAKNIPFDNLVFSLVSVYWRYSFLDVYKCIERLFSISFLEDLHHDLGIDSSLSLLQFSAKIEKYIGWRAEESKAINKLINNSPRNAINLLQEVKRFIDSKQADTLPSEPGEVIYKIRNSIVHLRPATDLKIINNIIDNKHWNKLIRASLLIIEYWYHKYDDQLNI